MELTDKNSVKFFNSKPKTLILDLNDVKFRPNLTPAQVLRRGAFGGTYFRDIESSVTGKKYSKVYREFPKSWFNGLDIKKQITRPWDDKNYNKSMNKYGVKVGATLEFWQDSGWITENDPYGWFQWYCRYYKGRRLKSTKDNKNEDVWQIGRFNKIVRFLGPLIKMIAKKENETKKENEPKKSYVHDYTIGAKYRQILLHWGYELTESEYQRLKKAKKVSFI